MAQEAGLTSRARDWSRRALGGAGPERDTVLLVVKSTLAACIAWGLVSGLMTTPAPAFAPFSAVLLVQLTVYQSVLQSLRYVIAVVVGVALQAGLGFLLGPTTVAFAVIALLALMLSRWRALGSQGPQVATAAFFAFSVFSLASNDSDRFTQLGQILVVVLIGCAVGVLVNLLIYPPLRYRSAEYGVRTVAHSMRNIVTDMSDSLRRGEMDEEDATGWRQRAEQLYGIVEQAHASVSFARESLYYNPRRMWRRNRGGSEFSGYAAVVSALERVARQLNSVTSTIEQRAAAEEQAHSQFFVDYGEFLATVAGVTEGLSELDEDNLSQLCQQLDDRVSAAEEACARLSHDTESGSLPLADQTRPYGVLLIEANRLLAEFQHTQRVLRQYVQADSVV